MARNASTGSVIELEPTALKKRPRSGKSPRTRPRSYPAEDDVYMTAPEVVARFKVSDMTLHRWLKSKDLGFPRPIVINPVMIKGRLSGRRLFRKSEILQYEQDRAKKAMAG